MKQKTDVKPSKFHIIYFILLALLPLAIFWIKDMTPIFFNNDDVFLKQIASGELTGTPEAHLLHIGYLTGLIISTLYQLFPALPWYGICLFSCMYVAVLLSIFPLFQYLKKAWQKLILTAVSILVMAGFLFSHMLQIQYTTVTATVCACSLVYFTLAKEENHVKQYLKNLIPCFILFAISFELRDKASIMMLPFFIFIGVSRFIKNRNLLKPLLSCAGILLSIIILLWGIESLAYAAPVWKDFTAYNTNRENIVDYSGYPSYENNAELYNSLGISYQSYVSASDHYQLLLDDNINLSFMEVVADACPERNVALSTLLKEFLERHITSYADRPLNLIVYVLYAMVFVMALLSRNYQSLWDILAVFAGRMTIWIYLLFMGRSVPRVTQGIYIAELFLLTAILFYYKMWQDKKEKRKKKLAISFALCILCISFVTFKWGLPYTERINQYNKSQLAYAVTYDEIRDYFYDNSDSFYMLDTNSFSYFTEALFTKTPDTAANFVLLGSWPANSPWTDKIAGEQNFTSYETAAFEDNVYFVFMNTEATGYDYLANYYTEKYPNSIFIVKDTVKTSTGVEFLILKCNG